MADHQSSMLQMQQEEESTAKCTLFVRNLPFSATNDNLEGVFSEIGPIKNCFVVRDKGVYDKCRGFGYVTYADRNDAKKALNSLHSFDGRKLYLKYADRKPPSNFNQRNKSENAVESSPFKRTLLSRDDDDDDGTPTKKKKAMQNQDEMSTGQPGGDKAIEKMQQYNMGVSGNKISPRQSNKQMTVKNEAEKTNPSQIIVRNLPFQCSEEDLQKAFEGIGNITEVTLSKMKANIKKCRGFGFVKFAEVSSATAALKKMNGQHILGRPIIVDLARSREQLSATRQQRTGVTEPGNAGESHSLKRALLTKHEDRTTPKKMKVSQNQNKKQKGQTGCDESNANTPQNNLRQSGNKTSGQFTPGDNFDQQKTIVIQNLSYKCSEKNLCKAFQGIGTIKEVKVPKFGGKSRGFGFVQFDDTSSPAAAVEKMNGQKIMGRPVKIHQPTGGSAEKSDSADESRSTKRILLTKEEDSTPSKKTKVTQNQNKKQKEQADGGKSKMKTQPNNLRQSGNKTSPGQFTPAENFDRQTTIIIKNLEYKCSEKDLCQAFEGIGSIKMAKIARKKNRSKGFGFLQFEANSSAAAALKKMNRQSIMGRPVTVAWAHTCTKEQLTCLHQPVTTPSKPGKTNQSIKLEVSSTTVDSDKKGNEKDGISHEEEGSDGDSRDDNESEEDDISENEEGSDGEDDDSSDDEDDVSNNQVVIKKTKTSDSDGSDDDSYTDESEEDDDSDEQAVDVISSDQDQKRIDDASGDDSEEESSSEDDTGSNDVEEEGEIFEMNKPTKKLVNEAKNQTLKKAVKQKKDALNQELSPKEASVNPNTARLVIRNLSFKCSEEELKKAFSGNGKIIDVKIPKMPGDGRKSRGFGFIQFEEISSAAAALKKMNRQNIKGRKVAVDWSIPREKYIEACKREAKGTTTPGKTNQIGNPSSSSEADSSDVEEDDVASFDQVRESRVHNSDEDSGSEFSDSDSDDVEVTSTVTHHGHSKDVQNDETSSDDDDEEDESGDEDVDSDDDESDDDDDESDDNDDEESDDDDDESDDNDDEESDDDDESDDNEDDSSEGNEIDSEEEGGKKAKSKKNKEPSRPSDVGEGKTLFVRNVPYESTEEDLRELFAKFGNIEFCKVVVDKDTDHSKGSAFLKYESKEDAEKCLRKANANTQDEDFTLATRRLDVTQALPRNDIEQMRKALKKQEKSVNKDKRNLYLLREGLVREGTQAAQGVPEAEIAKRTKIESVKRNKLKDINVFVSPTRMVVHNLPKSFDDAKLKKMFFDAAGDKMAKIKEARIMRDMKSPNTEGVCRSMGFAFVEFTEHEHALTALRHVNNNPTYFGGNKRPIVGFSLENRIALEVKEKRLNKSKIKGAEKPILRDRALAGPNQAEVAKKTHIASLSKDKIHTAPKTKIRKGLPSHMGPKQRWRDKGKLPPSKKKEVKVSRGDKLWKQEQQQQREQKQQEQKLQKELKRSAGKPEGRNRRRRANEDKREESNFTKMVAQYKNKLFGSNKRTSPQTKQPNSKKWFNNS